MNQDLLNLLRKNGPLCVEEISDALMWEEDVVHMALIPLVKAGAVHLEIDGTVWFAQEVAA